MIERVVERDRRWSLWRQQDSHCTVWRLDCSVLQRIYFLPLSVGRLPLMAGRSCAVRFCRRFSMPPCGADPCPRQRYLYQVVTCVCSPRVASRELQVCKAGCACVRGRGSTASKCEHHVAPRRAEHARLDGLAVHGIHVCICARKMVTKGREYARPATSRAHRCMLLADGRAHTEHAPSTAVSTSPLCTRPHCSAGPAVRGRPGVRKLGSDGKGARGGRGREGGGCEEHRCGPASTRSSVKDC